MRLAGLPRRRPWALRPGSPAGTGKKTDFDRPHDMVRPPGGGAPPDAAASRLPASMASSSAAWPSPFGLVALAAGKHPFPSRTRPLRLHAVMILRPGARESNASPILILQIPCPLEGRGFFCFPRISRGSRSPRISRISGASRNSRSSASARRRGRRRDRRRFAARVAPPGLKSPLSAFRGFAPLSRRFTPG